MSSISTKLGDLGQTSLAGGLRVSKASLRVESYGTVDELNSHIGLLRDVITDKEKIDLLINIQDRLFTIEDIASGQFYNYTLLHTPFSLPTTLV